MNRSDGQIKGLFSAEIEILKALEQKFLFRSNLIYAFNSWGSYSNDTWRNGLIRDVVMGISQIGICCITIDFERYKFVDYTSYIYVESIKIISSLPKLQQNNWALIGPFSLSVWLLLVVSFILIYITLKLSQLFNDNLTSNIVWLNLIGIPIKQSLHNLSIQHNSMQCQLYALWLLSSIIFANLYSSNLYSMLTVPNYEKTIDTIEDLRHMLQNNERFIRFEKHSYLWSVIEKSNPDDGIFYEIKQNVLNPQNSWVKERINYDNLLNNDRKSIIIGEGATFRVAYSSLYQSKESLGPDVLGLIVAKGSPIRMPINFVYVIR